MTAEHDGIDALMAAITDEPLSEEARGDSAFMAEHRSASADLALLREQLGVIGHALAEPVQAPAPAPAPSLVPAPKPARVGPSRTRRWVPKLALGGLAVAAAASVVAGLGWLIATGGPDAMSGSEDSGSSAQKSGADADAGTRFGSPYYLACTRLVVEGTVTSVERLVDGVQLRITVEVSRYYKQDGQQPDTLTYVIEDTFSRGLVKGDQVLFGVPKGDAVPDHWVVGEKAVARERAWITASLPESRKLTC
ncbi:hypothetical protein [Streptomyces sp. WM6386]|uniref:hypothetical protein n=1 Tax=Streptomyces sp. WM6386 TaxID=1415558 RepID=UPI00061EA3C6|nr:hypothetical protein [Streptomyces sp. WM6386]KKD06573.1 hypothetical protein TN53_18175 [Streptomyces sp. WM6386]